jgi:putative cardiolipin synthase
VRAAACLLLALLGSCRTLPSDPERVPTRALPPAAQGPIAEAARGLGPGLNGFHLLTEGPEAVQWRLALIDTAKSSLDLQYYIWRRDAVGTLMTDRLIRAAARGVRVRVLVDDFTVTNEDREIAILSRQPNIAVRVFNPSWIRGKAPVSKGLEQLFTLQQVNHRMHNKLFVADNRIAIVGGRNIADEYFGLSEKYNFIDTDTVVAGPVVRGLSERFDEYWNSDTAYPGRSLMRDVEEEDLGDTLASLAKRREKHMKVTGPLELGEKAWVEWLAGLPKRFEAGRAEVLYDVVSDQRPSQVAERLEPLGTEAKTEVVMAMAYLMPDDEMLDWFRGMTKRGVKVRVVTNSVPTYDSSTGASFYANRRLDILEAGVELHELRPDAVDRGLGEKAAGEIGLHAKLMVFDRQRVFVGSFNLEPRASKFNTENGLVAEAPGLAERARKRIEQLMEPRNSWALSLEEGRSIVWTSHDGKAYKPPSGSGILLVHTLFGLIPEDYR